MLTLPKQFRRSLKWEENIHNVNTNHSAQRSVVVIYCLIMSNINQCRSETSTLGTAANSCVERTEQQQETLTLPAHGQANCHSKPTTLYTCRP
eukprot:2724998-Amphidinium_carterae.1